MSHNFHLSFLFCFNLQSQYCLITYTNTFNDPDDILDENRSPIFNEYVIPEYLNIVGGETRIPVATNDSSRLVENDLSGCKAVDTKTPFLHSAVYKVGKCLPYECSLNDVR